MTTRANRRRKLYLLLMGLQPEGEHTAAMADRLAREVMGSEEATPLQIANLRIAFLTELVLDLLVEVEALREGQLEAAEAEGQRGKDTPYGRAWRRVVELSHNAAGPSSGIEKIFRSWSGSAQDAEGGSGRELAMLERLGYADDEIEAFLEHLEQLETYT